MMSAPFSFWKAATSEQTPTPSPAWALATVLAALLVTGFGLFAMLHAPKVPYADAWRFLTDFLSEPFPRNVLGLGNGHVEQVPGHACGRTADVWGGAPEPALRQACTPTAVALPCDYPRRT